MFSHSPLIYEPEKSISVFNKTEDYLKQNIEVNKNIIQLGWMFHSLRKLIPQNWENIFSGHSFPFEDSLEEFQVSTNLCFLGFYKQAFISLRNALELALLCIYFNIDDDGHLRIQDWLKSKQKHEANTPRSDKIWKVLLSNKNIKQFDSLYNLRGKFDSLSFLSNYVHSKGIKYSNRVGLPKPNFQTFEEKAFNSWVSALTQIIEVIALVYLLRYPIGLIKYDWSIKSGIDNPFPVLEEYEIEKIENFISLDQFNTLKNIAENDFETQQLYNHILNLPDMDSNDIEDQIIRLDKLEIESGIGFIEWEKKETQEFHLYSEQERERIKKRIDIIRVWAEENNLMNRITRS